MNELKEDDIFNFNFTGFRELPDNANSSYHNVDNSNWHEYAVTVAPGDLLCEFWRPATAYTEEQQWIGYARDFSDAFNIGNLRWRLTGIAKEELAAMREQGRYVCFLCGGFSNAGMTSGGLAGLAGLASSKEMCVCGLILRGISQQVGGRL